MAIHIKRFIFGLQFLFTILLSGACLFIAGCATKSESAGKGEGKTVAGSSFGATTNTTNYDAVFKDAAAKPSAPLEGEGWKPLYDGKSLNGWAVSDFGGHGGVQVESGLITIDMGDALSGVNYTNGGLPTVNYEVALDAMKISGSDFFCGLTFPVDDSYASLILGGWGGGTVGISSIDNEDASENETSKVMRFDTNRWYRVRVRVTERKIEAWLDNDKIVDVEIVGKKIGLRFGEIELSKPLGIATYQTTAAVREVKLRKLEARR